MVTADTKAELGLTDKDLEGLDELDNLVPNSTAYAAPDVLADAPDSEPENWLCPICSKDYDDESEFNFHVSKRHPEYVPPRDPEPANDVAAVLDDDDRLPAGELPPDLGGDALDLSDLDNPADAARQEALAKLHAEHPESFPEEQPKRRRASKAEMEERKAKAIAEAALAETAAKQAAPLAGTTDDVEERRQEAFRRLNEPTAIASDAPAENGQYADEAPEQGIPPMSEQEIEYTTAKTEPRPVKIRLDRSFATPPPDALVPWITVNFEIAGRMDDVAKALALVGGVLRDNEIEWRTGE